MVLSVSVSPEHTDPRKGNVLVKVPVNPINHSCAQWSHDAVGDVLKGVIEFGGDGAHGPVHHLLHQQLELLLGQRHVKTLLQATDGAGAVETGKVGTCKQTNKGRQNREADGDEQQLLVLMPMKRSRQNRAAKSYLVA